MLTIVERVTEYPRTLHVHSHSTEHYYLQARRTWDVLDGNADGETRGSFRTQSEAEHYVRRCMYTRAKRIEYQTMLKGALHAYRAATP